MFHWFSLADNAMSPNWARNFAERRVLEKFFDYTPNVENLFTNVRQSPLEVDVLMALIV